VTCPFLAWNEEDRLFTKNLEERRWLDGSGERKIV
jgi:hypothetical protein